jgi:hypothetical protein
MPPRSPQMQAKGAGQASTRKRSFLVGTQLVEEGYDYQPPAVTSTTGGSFQPWTLQGTGWLARLWFEFAWTATGGTLGANPDYPFLFISNVQLNDVNNEAIFGPFDGYTWYLTNKMGGYYDWDDPATLPGFASAAAAGQFLLFIPLEIVNRDPIGPVASVNNTATLTVLLQVNALAGVYSTVPSPFSMTVVGTQEFYWEPRKSDKQGRPIAGAPPANGTTQYWTQGSVPVNPGTINQQLITGLGYPFREYLFMARLGASTTALSNRGTYNPTTGATTLGEAGLPATFNSLKFEANMLLTQYDKLLWVNYMAKILGYPGARDVRTAGSVPGLENGVYGLFFNKDFFKNTVGGETRRTYLVTSPGSNFIINWTIGGAASGNLYSVVNYVAPGGGGASAARSSDTASLTGGA